MINVNIRNLGRPLKLLVIGAHCDDIEIGCGGTILKLLQRVSDVNLTWVVMTSNELRKTEAEASAALFSADAGSSEIMIRDFPDGFLPYHGKDVKTSFENLKQQLNPDLILTHYRHDLHQDHRLVSELTWNTFRDHLILEYEIPKWDGDLGNPDTFIHLDQEVGKLKIRHLMSAYQSQQAKSWFTDDLFWSLMRLRGMESNAPEGLAEGFYGRKTLLDF